MPDSTMKPSTTDLTVHELQDLIESVAIRVFETSALRLETDEDDEGNNRRQMEVATSLQASDQERSMQVRLKLELQRPEARIVVDCGAQFYWVESQRPAVFGALDEDSVNMAGREFIERVGIPYLISYIRPMVDQLTRTLEIPVAPVPIDYFRDVSISLENAAASPDN
ncbi:hypothetical protein [Prescottella equi]|uniref:hypothetical protein n=1 Tax=Rhodococcus hoagii TaxID=43767 RepID=UPI00111C6ED6|nr:hypothetical protein [Prescottella equi]